MIESPTTSAPLPESTVPVAPADPRTPPTSPPVVGSAPTPPVSPPPGASVRSRPVVSRPSTAEAGALPQGAPTQRIPLIPPQDDPSVAGGESDRPRRRWAAPAALVAGAAIALGGVAVGRATADDPVAAVAPVSTVTDAPASTLPAAPAPADDAGESVAPVPAAPSSADAVAVVAASLGPSVIQVETDRGLGSGVVFDDDRILTNHHVIEGANEVVVRTSEGRTLAATLVGSDERNDIAVLSVNPGSGLPVAPLALDGELAVGQLAVAIGSPFQLSQTVTAGIVSSLNRPVPNAVGSLNAMIQTDAPINPGNSGGALADANGRVIGINTSIRTDGDGNGNVGIGFALPIDTAVDVASRIIAGSSLEPGVLGITASTVSDAEVGVPIGEVVDGGAAQAAGLQAGDRILSVDGAPVTDFGDVIGLVQANFAGDEVAVEIIRDGQRLTLTATLAS